MDEYGNLFVPVFKSDLGEDFHIQYADIDIFNGSCVSNVNEMAAVQI